jgi:uncharacterized cofD-like protein
MKKVVVMGGGTGTFPVISGLKHEEINLSTIITVSDSGGSTGRIRDEFGFQPVGDLRQALAALADSEGSEWIRKILVYRFNKGNGLQGHNLGNLILTALQDMTGSTTEALQIAEKVFRIDGQVIPVTEDNVNLEIVYEDGSKIVGEHILDQSVLPIAEPKKIDHINLVPHAQINPQAAEVIRSADMIVIGPGDYYASLLSTLVPVGVKEAFAQTSAKLVYIVNLMTRITQTHKMTAKEHVLGIEKAIGKKINKVVMNSSEIPSAVLGTYAKEREYPVIDDLNGDDRVIRADLLSDELAMKNAHDTAHRSLLRHDPNKLRMVLASILNENI